MIIKKLFGVALCLVKFLLYFVLEMKFNLDSFNYFSEYSFNNIGSQNV